MFYFLEICGRWKAKLEKKENNEHIFTRVNKSAVNFFPIQKQILKTAKENENFVRRDFIESEHHKMKI